MFVREERRKGRREGDRAHSLRPPFSKESTRRVITKRKIRNGGAADDAIAALDGWPIEHTARLTDRDGARNLG